MSEQSIGPFQFESDDITSEVKRLQQLPRFIQEAEETVLRAIGVQVVSWAVQDYRARSEGREAGGATWKPLSDGAIYSRISARTPWQRDTEQLKALREQEKPILDELRRKLPKGKTPAKKKARGAIISKFMKERPDLRRIKANRKRIREKRKKMFEKEKGAAKIGIDTGRGINSLVFGVADLKSIKTGSKVTDTNGMENAVFDLGRGQITVGSGIKYMQYFAEARPIFPSGFIDQSRQDQLTELAEEVIAKVIEGVGRG